MPDVRRRLSPALRFLLAGSFLIPLASFMVMPFMAVFLHTGLHWGFGLIGWVLAVASFVQYGGGMAGGAVAARIGLKPAMVLALLVRTVGFGLFLPAMWSPPFAVVALLLSSAGAALYLPANKAYVVANCDVAERGLFLSLSNSAFNGGMAVGPLIAGLFIVGHPAAVFAVVTVAFAVLAVFHAVVLRPLPAAGAPPVRPGSSSRRAGWVSTLACAPVLVTVISLYVFMFFQNFLSQFVTAHYSAELFSVLLLINSAIVVAVQPLLAGRISALGYRTAIAGSFTLIAIGLAGYSRGDLVGLVAGTVAVSAGEIVLFLKNELEPLRRLDRPPAVVYGYLRLAAGIGSFASAVAGGHLYQYSLTLPGGDRSFWLFGAGQGVLGGLCALAVVTVADRRRARAGPAAAVESHAASGA